MKPWLRLTIIALTVGGGFSGVVRTLESLSIASTFGLVASVVFVGLYLFVFASGLLFVHDPKRTGQLEAALALQIPFISSPVFTYKFAAGVQALGYIGSSEKGSTAGVSVGWYWGLGSSWLFALGHENPLRVGINGAALLILVLLWRTQRSDSKIPVATNQEALASQSPTPGP